MQRARFPWRGWCPAVLGLALTCPLWLSAHDARAEGLGACGDPATPIHVVQGESAGSPLAGSTGVVVEAVVVASFATSDQLGGLHLQEEDADVDADPRTSEGLFVDLGGFAFAVEPAPGDVVRVRGTVAELATGSGSSLTALTGLEAGAPCGAGVATPADVVLPVASLGDLERFEGMMIELAQELTVTGNATLGRFGDVELAAGGRHFAPTQLVAPGGDALDRADLHERSRILLDDGSTRQNPDPIRHPEPGGLGAANTLRAGDTVAGLRGVLEERFGRWRLQPVAPVPFASANPRPQPPAPVAGALRVVGFNVQNYFNGNGSGGGFPTPRGASTLAEFARQRAKILAALAALEPDVVGVVEIENDGFGAASAIADLAAGLDVLRPEAGYAFVDPGVPAVGSDEIAVGLLFASARVAPAGAAAVLDASVDPRFRDDLNRPSLAQTFADRARGDRFTVAVNHWKSKGSSCASAGDPDLGDGQGNCNATRTAAAAALADWLAGDPTGNGDPDVLVIGDLNSYAQEDPIRTLVAAGYRDLAARFANGESYSYVFNGAAGTLDYALASPALDARVAAAGAWHVNADEPAVLGYDVEFESAGQVLSLYAPDPFRSSDHDPLVVDLVPEPGAAAASAAALAALRGTRRARAASRRWNATHTLTCGAHANSLGACPR